MRRLMGWPHLGVDAGLKASKQTDKLEPKARPFLEWRIA